MAIDKTYQCTRNLESTKRLPTMNLVEEMGCLAVLVYSTIHLVAVRYTSNAMILAIGAIHL